jgi:uncharacterized Zn finger protein
VSPWDEGRFPRYSPKKPAPAQGIKVNKLGTTWWGQRWIEALERVLQGDSGRLARGRTYARAGRAHDLVIQGGKVKAKVTGSREPYDIGIELAQLSDATWQAALAFMAQKAEFSAMLLNNEMPRQIDEAFQAASASLFPKTRADLETSCDCPDYGDPCKHIAAVHYVLGDAFDRDPFLLFELRGRSREQVFAALRAARGERPKAPRSKPIATGSDKPSGVALGKLTAKSYDAAPVPLPTLSFSFEPPPADAAVLRQLGAPRGWNRETLPIETLTPMLQTAAATARRLALSEAELPSPAPNPTPPPSKPKTRRRRKTSPRES